MLCPACAAENSAGSRFCNGCSGALSDDSVRTITVVALIAPDSKLSIHADANSGVEVTVRESGEFIYVLAARREAETAQIKFSGVPKGIADGAVLFEDPRAVQVPDGSFTDWFGPHDVHLYRFAGR
jgi:hypothetical protein